MLTFSEIAIARGCYDFDWIKSNLELVSSDPMHPISQFLDRIQVIIPILRFLQDSPTYKNLLRSHIPEVYAASIPDARLGVTNMEIIHANQLFDDWESYPKCLTFEYAEVAK